MFSLKQSQLQIYKLKKLHCDQQLIVQFVFLSRNVLTQLKAFSAGINKLLPIKLISLQF